MREMAMQYPVQVGLGEVYSSNGWFVKFCKRFGLVLRRRKKRNALWFKDKEKTLSFMES